MSIHDLIANPPRDRPRDQVPGRSGDRIQDTPRYRDRDPSPRDSLPSPQDSPPVRDRAPVRDNPPVRDTPPRDPPRDRVRDPLPDPPQSRPKPNSGLPNPPGLSDPQDDLEKKWGPVWGTPNRPIEPWECDKWPNSPYCEGNPIDTVPIDFQINIVNNDCWVGIEICPTLVFVKFACIQYLYKKDNPACDQPPPDKEWYKEKTIDDQPPGFDPPLLTCKGLSWVLWSGNPDDTVLEFNYPSKYKYAMASVPIYIQTLNDDYIESGSYQSMIRPIVDTSPHFLDEVNQDSSVGDSFNTRSYWWEYPNLDFVYLTSENGKKLRKRGFVTFKHAEYDIYDDKGNSASVYSGSPSRMLLYRCNGATINSVLKKHNPNNTSKELAWFYEFWWNKAKSVDDIPDTTWRKFMKNYHMKVIYTSCDIPVYDPLPPIDNLKDKWKYKDKECDCMSCCDDSLSKLILKMVTELKTDVNKLKDDLEKTKKIIGDFPIEIEITDDDPKKQGEQKRKVKIESVSQYIKENFEFLNDMDVVLGISRFPAKLPSRLVKPNGKGEETIKDLPEFLGYIVKQIDKSIGLLPQKIKIADSDLAKKGDQSLEVEIHSLADFARETLKILLDQGPESDIHTNMLVRILYELGFIHQGNIQILADVDAMVEHMDFKHKFIAKEYPFAFNPYCQNNTMARGFGQQKTDKELKEPAKLPNIASDEKELEKILPEFLKQTWIKVRTIENIEKRSLNQDIQAIRRDANTSALAVSAKATPEAFEQLVDNAMIKLQIDDTIQQISTRKALTSGDQRTRRQSKDKKKK